MTLDKELDPKKEGFAKAYQSKVNEYNKKNVSEYNLQELKNWYELFNESFLDINRKYAGYTEKTLSETHNLEYKVNFEVAGVYISQIQNRFLTPINNEISKRQIEENLEKADRSIQLGKRSIHWAIFALAITFISSVLAFLDIKSPLNKTVPPQSECKCDTTKNN